MYREKLISQIEMLEKTQHHCEEVHEVVTLGREILYLSKKVDELDENAAVVQPVEIVSPKEVVAKAIKETIDNLHTSTKTPQFC